MRNKRGFTLIELLTVIGILSVIGTIVVVIISLTFRGTNKSNLLENARQNGDTVLSQIVRSIRYAQSLDSPSPSACYPVATVSAITVTSLTDYAQTTYSCPTALNNYSISSNSASLIDTGTLVISSCSFTCTQSSPVEPPTINIQFTLTASNAGSFTETNFTLPFQSSVTMRNY